MPMHLRPSRIVYVADGTRWPPRAKEKGCSSVCGRACMCVCVANERRCFRTRPGGEAGGAAGVLLTRWMGQYSRQILAQRPGPFPFAPFIFPLYIIFTLRVCNFWTAENLEAHCP